MRDRGVAVTVLSFDSRRYVGATIGIHDPSGKKVGTVSHTRNTEYVLVAGDLSPAQTQAVGGTRDDVTAPPVPSRAWRTVRSPSPMTTYEPWPDGWPS